MVKISVMYPTEAGAHFDLDYYENKHIPMIRALLGSACYDISLDKGISALPGQPPRYSVICHILSKSIEAILAALGEHKPELDADVPNFTNQLSFVQISEIIVPGRHTN